MLTLCVKFLLFCFLVTLLFITNAKVQVVVIESECLKKTITKLQNEVKKCKKTCFGTNEYSNNIKLKETLNEGKMDTMRWDVSEIKHVMMYAQQSHGHIHEH